MRTQGDRSTLGADAWIQPQGRGTKGFNVVSEWRNPPILSIAEPAERGPMRYLKQVRQRGYVLVATSVSAIVLVSGMGVAIDMGKMYIAKSELQAFVDSASVSAALELDGTSAGIARAKAAAAATGLKWNFNSTTTSAPTVEFAANGAGPWAVTPSNASGHRWARVTSTQQVKMFFLPVLVKKYQTPVQSRSVAAQVAKTIWREGLFPFSPYAHNATPPDFGLQRGDHY
ncbi:MAG TPA: hypothetical protein DEH78_10335, partial [Solibacterales bacterium]|nr:hypothetical protein [Bryobacterales bacterium]